MRTLFLRVASALDVVEAAALAAALGDSPGAALVVPAPLEPIWDATVLQLLVAVQPHAWL